MKLSTDIAIAAAKKFMHTIALTVDAEDQIGVAIWEIDDLEKYQSTEERKQLAGLEV